MTIVLRRLLSCSAAKAVRGSGKYPLREEAAFALTLMCAAAPAAVLRLRPAVAATMLRLANDEDRYVMGCVTFLRQCSDPLILLRTIFCFCTTRT